MGEVPNSGRLCGVKRGLQISSELLFASWCRMQQRGVFLGPDWQAVVLLILCSVFRSRTQPPTSLPSSYPACLPISHPLRVRVYVYVYHNYRAGDPSPRPPPWHPCSPATPHCPVCSQSWHGTISNLPLLASWVWEERDHWRCSSLSPVFSFLFLHLVMNTASVLPGTFYCCWPQNVVLYSCLHALLLVGNNNFPISNWFCSLLHVENQKIFKGGKTLNISSHLPCQFQAWIGEHVKGKRVLKWMLILALKWVLSCNEQPVSWMGRLISGADIYLFWGYKTPL